MYATNLSIRLLLDFRREEDYSVEREMIETDLWSLTHEQLAKQCQSIAKDDSPTIAPSLRAEAERLVASWRDALLEPAKDFQKQTHRAVQLDGLRKRTIEILIRTGRGR
jgi:hypothetical protein